MPDDTPSQPGKNQKIQTAQYENKHKEILDLFLKIADIEQKLKHAIFSIHHQIKADKIRNMLIHNHHAEFETDITDARMIIKCLEQHELITQQFLAFSHSDLKTELERVSSNISKSTADIKSQNVAIDLLRESIKAIIRIDKELRRVEKTIIKAKETLEHAKHDFNKIKNEMIARTPELVQPSHPKGKFK